MPEFEFIEHTADLGLRVYGKTREDLFRNYAAVLIDLITDHKASLLTIRKIHLEAQSLGELLVDWLNELLSIFFADGFLPGVYILDIIDDKGGKILRAEIKGQNVSFENIRIKREIKAATYHDLKVEENDNGYVAEVIFDI